MVDGTRTMTQICKEEPDMPTRTEIFLWCGQDKELADILTRAQRGWCLAQSDEIIKICDDDTRDVLVDEKGISRSDNTAVNRDKLRVTTRQWAMARFRPDLFGDKIEQKIDQTIHTVSADPMSVEEFSETFLTPKASDADESTSN
jgi:hypothetical protein